MFKFSIIIACYNAEAKLSKTIESVINQNIKEVQLIIIDGGSTDYSNEIFKKYKNNIDTLISEKDSGIADAWNKGLKYVKGEFVNFLNAGDFYDTNMLNRVYENCLKYNDNFIGYGDTTLFDDHSKDFKVGNYYKKQIFLVNGFSFMHPTVFFPSNLITKVGNFNVNKRIAMDTDWLLRCIKSQVVFHNINSHVYMERGGISSKYVYGGMGEYLDSLISQKFPIYYIPLFFFARLVGSLKLLFNINTIKEC
jgi:glycosyltransferase involved in cell wall biosynthesis